MQLNTLLRPPPKDEGHVISKVRMRLESYEGETQQFLWESAPWFLNQDKGPMPTTEAEGDHAKKQPNFKLYVYEELFLF